MKRSCGQTLKILILGALFARIAKVLLSYFTNFGNKCSYVNGDMQDTKRHHSTQKTPETIGDTINMVCWLTTMAQPYLKVINTGTLYRLVQTIDPSEFYQLKVSVINEAQLHEVDELHQCDNLAFSVEIHTIVFKKTLFNKIYLKIKELKNRLSKSTAIEKEIDKDAFMRNFSRTRKKHTFLTLCPTIEMKYRPMILKYRLMEYLPCGISKFSISSECSSDLPLKEIVNYVGNDIFNMLHLFFHNHHFHEMVNTHNVPFYPDEYIQLRDRNNKAIEFYVTRMGNGFADMVNEVYLTYKDFLYLEKHPQGKKKMKRKKRIKSIRKFYQDCDNLLGMHAFFNAILSSPQNTHWILNGEYLTPEEERRKEMAVIIDNSHKGTEALMRKISHYQDDRNFSKSMTWAAIGIWVSIGMGILGILMSMTPINEPVTKWMGEKWNWFYSICCNIYSWIVSFF